jgi:hypothetical protein
MKMASALFGVFGADPFVELAGMDGALVLMAAPAGK